MYGLGFDNINSKCEETTLQTESRSNFHFCNGVLVANYYYTDLLHHQEIYYLSDVKKTYFGHVSEVLEHSNCVKRFLEGIPWVPWCLWTGRPAAAAPPGQVLDAALQSLELQSVALPGPCHLVFHAGDGASEIHVLLVHLDVLPLLLDHGLQLVLEVQEHGLPFFGMLLHSFHPLSWELQVGRLVGGSIDWIFEEFHFGWKAELKSKVG